MPHLRMPLYLRTLQQLQQQQEQQQKQEQQEQQQKQGQQQQPQQQSQQQQREQQPLSTPAHVNSPRSGSPEVAPTICTAAEPKQTATSMPTQHSQQAKDVSRGQWGLRSNPITAVASLFGLGSNDEEPVDPFTLYGTNFKKFYIGKVNS